MVIVIKAVKDKNSKEGAKICFNPVNHLHFLGTSLKVDRATTRQLVLTFMKNPAFSNA